MLRAASATLLSLTLCAAACGGEPGAAPADGEHVGTSSEELLTTVTPGPSHVEGIDVSHYQGAIDWASEKAKGRMFGVASVGDGSYQDPTFATNWAAMKAAGVIRGAYQFFEPAEDPIAQADILIAKVGKLGDGDLPATIDVETAGGQSAATVAAKVGTWLARVEAGTGRKPMIYTGPYFWQGSVASLAYGSYPLWVADYGVSKPQVPAPWKNYAIWQYSDSNGTLDVDSFQGTLADLQAFARAPGAAMSGVLDAAACTGITGWAQDPSAPTKAAAVTLSFDGAAGAKTAEALAGIDASVTRSDLCKPLGSCDHGFDVPVPLGVRDGKAHQVFAYGAKGSALAELTNAPKSLTCAAPAPPVTPATGVKRLLPTPAVVTAWKISMLTDVAHLDDAVINALPKGDDVPAAPELLIGDDGAPAVWLIDGGKRRHVVSPSSMTAWHFVAPKKTPAAALVAMPQGADWSATPFLVTQGTPQMLYVLDAPDAPPGAGAGAGAGPHGTDPGAHSDGAAVAAPEPAPEAGGCQLAAPRRTGGGGAPLSGAAGAVGLALACVGALRRRGLRAGTTPPKLSYSTSRSPDQRRMDSSMSSKRCAGTTPTCPTVSAPIVTVAEVLSKNGAGMLSTLVSL
jgi:GH25 family lysozyme M1 (1,4-beta-N-acetylmuramidase)